MDSDDEGSGSDAGIEEDGDAPPDSDRGSVTPASDDD